MNFSVSVRISMLQFFARFDGCFHCPGKNTLCLAKILFVMQKYFFCHDKNPTSQNQIYKYQILSSLNV